MLNYIPPSAIAGVFDKFSLVKGNVITVINDFSGSFIFTGCLMGFRVYPIYVGVQSKMCSCSSGFGEYRIIAGLEKWNNFCIDYNVTSNIVQRPTFVPSADYLENESFGQNVINCDKDLKISDNNYLIKIKHLRSADIEPEAGDVSFETEQRDTSKFNKDIYMVNYSKLYCN